MAYRELALILTSVSLSALAQVAFKLGVSSPKVRAALTEGGAAETVMSFIASPAIVGGLALYGIGTLLWLNVLAKTELSQAYPFVGLGFAFTAFLGYALFNDTLSPMRLTGTAVVIAGIVLVARG
ncbi:MAG TPA: EamA family transporter [Stellaceae bacterium]|jgi:multidrug transporter EmrE-like cation transporter|nr:EamA family transporter [Stellaceae bacterium]